VNKKCVKVERIVNVNKTTHRDAALLTEEKRLGATGNKHTIMITVI
jgi:hypothetical protein